MAYKRSGGYRPKRSGGYKPRRSGSYKPKRSGGYKKRSGGGGCYIATASLGNQACLYLDDLRNYRDNFLESFDLGRKLVSYYRSSAPKVAEFIKEKSFLKKSFLYPFILPALFLTKKVKGGKVLGFVKNIALFVIFIFALSWAWVLDKTFGINK